jgi:hypothetical protein
MTVNLVETFKLPMSGALVDFRLRPIDAATELTFHYSYTPNLIGRLLGKLLGKQLSTGLDGIVTGLQRECERRAAQSGRTDARVPRSDFPGGRDATPRPPTGPGPRL